MNVFVYGTLRDPDRARDLLGHADYGPDVTLEGLHRVEGTYPTLAPGGSVEGRLLRVDASGLRALDRYEGVETGLYVRVRVPSGDGEAQMYVGDPARLDSEEAVEWPGAGTLRERVSQYVEEEGVVVR